MRILVVNPNSTRSMTEKIAHSASELALPTTEIVAANPENSPVSIEGFFDEALSVPPTIDLIGRHSGVDAIIIACFDDTGVDAVRCTTEAPVIGIGEAAFHMASILSCQFGVVTTLSRAIPALRHNLAKYGLASRCSGIRASDLAVLDLERQDSDAYGRISREVSLALSEDGAEAIVLGCAGMTDLASRLAEEHGCPVLDGVGCAVAICEGLVRLGYRTSKVCGYQYPRVK